MCCGYWLAADCLVPYQCRQGLGLCCGCWLAADCLVPSAARGWVRAGAGRSWQQPPEPTAVAAARPGSCTLCGQSRALHASGRLFKQRRTKETKKVGCDRIDGW